MKTLSSSLITEKNKLFSANSWIPLVHFDFTTGTGDDLYLCGNNEDITYQSKVYTKFPMEVQFQSNSIRGELSEAVLRLGNVTRVIQTYLEGYTGAVDANVRITFVNTGYLSDDYSNLTWDFYVTETNCDEIWATFNLGIYSLLAIRFPRYRYYSTFCRWKFKGLECGYAGSLENCNRHYDSCKTFSNVRQFGGFPGITNVQIRYLL